jgi:hypothetical protein
VTDKEIALMIKPSNEYDQELLARGKKRALVHAQNLAQDTGKKDADGNPIYTWGSVYREVIVPVNSNGKKKRKGVGRMNVDQSVVNVVSQKKVFGKAKTPRTGTKLEQAVGIVSEVGKDDKPACLTRLVEAMGVSRGNASIYYAKAREILSQE